MTEATPVAQPVPDVAPTAPVVAPAPAASPSPESAPAVAEPSAPSPSSTPATADPTVGADTPKPDEAAPAVDAPKPEDAAAADVPKPEGETAEAKPAAPVYTEFKMPEGVVAEAPIISAYTNILGKYNLPQEAGQELLDFHAAQIKTTTDRIIQQQQDDYAKMRQGWVKEFQKSAGNRQDTILNEAKAAVVQFGGDKKQQAELWGVLNMTGAGDHPAVIRAFANVAKAFRERGAPQHGNPVAAPSDPVTRRYGPAKRA